MFLLDIYVIFMWTNLDKPMMFLVTMEQHIATFYFNNNDLSLCFYHVFISLFDSTCFICTCITNHTLNILMFSALYYLTIQIHVYRFVIRHVIKFITLNYWLVSQLPWGLVLNCLAHSRVLKYAKALSR